MKESTKELNKGYFIARIIMSFLIGVSIFLDSIIVFGKADGKVYWSNSGYKYVYFTSPTIKKFIIALVIMVISFFAITFVGLLGEKIKEKFYNDKTTPKLNNIQFYFIYFGLILLMWLPYLLQFFPGGYDPNTRDILLQAQGKQKLTNHYSIIYTLVFRVIFKIVFSLGGNVQITYTIISILHTLIMCAGIAYFILWWHKKNVNRNIIIILLLYFGLFPIIPYYAVSIVREAPFAIFIVVLSFLLLDLILSKGEKLNDIDFIAEICINVFIIASLRNNGIYVVAAVFFVVLFCYLKYRKNMIPIWLTIIAIYIIQNPICSYFGINTEYREKLGVPLQQIAYVIVYNGKITPEQMDYLNQIVSLEKLKNKYSPWNVDFIKFDSDFDYKKVEKNKQKFFKTWIQIGMQNPKMYTKAYILHTTGFWDIRRQYNGDIKDYVNPFINYGDNLSKFLNIKQYHLLENGIFNIILVMYRNIINYACFEFLILIGLTYIFKEKKYKFIIAYLPSLFAVGTMLIATPIAFGLRYVFYVILFMPFAFMIPFLNMQMKNKKFI